MNTLRYIIVLVAALFCGSAYAEDVNSSDPVSEASLADLTAENVYVFPHIEPEITVSGGYRFVHLNGSAGAAEYEYLHNSVLFGSEIRTLYFPHRFHLYMDFRNEKDFEGDLSYAYKDKILLRGMSRSIFHNLENFRLIDLDPTPPLTDYGVVRKDSAKEYGVDTRMDSINLKLKPWEFPAHLFVEGRFVDKDGTMQQRFLGGAAYWILPDYAPGITRVSRKRTIDWKTKEYTIGANSHLGPVEVEYSHTEKRFDAGGDRFFRDAYIASGDGSFFGSILRSAGTYAHNRVPDLKGSTDSLKLHTSYTGGFVAAATFSKTRRENETSNAKADYFVGAGDLTWIATPQLAFFLKYNHKEADIDNSDADTLGNSCSPSNKPGAAYACNIVRSISSVTDTVSGTVRYKPLTGVLLRAGYTYDTIRRENADKWDLEDSTERNAIFVSADLKPIKGVTLKAKYTHKDIDHPENNAAPNSADEGKLSISWIPTPKISTLLSYSILKEEGNDLHFLNEAGDAVKEKGADRKAQRDRLLGSITYVLLNDLSVTVNYAYMHNKIRQDVAYSYTSPEPPPAYIDTLVPYTNIVNSYGLGIAYMPAKQISLNADIQHSVTKGNFYPSASDLLKPVSVASFSQLNMKETVLNAGGEYFLRNGLTIGMHYQYSSVNDVLNNPNDDVKDGEAHMLHVTVTKKW